MPPRQLAQLDQIVGVFAIAGHRLLLNQLILWSLSHRGSKSIAPPSSTQPVPAHLCSEADRLPSRQLRGQRICRESVSAARRGSRKSAAAPYCQAHARDTIEIPESPAPSHPPASC